MPMKNLVAWLPPLRWGMQASSSSQDTPLDSARPPRISWAAEPWADEETILLSNGDHEAKDMRPLRKSKLRSDKSFFKRRIADTELPLYDHDSKENARVSKGYIYLSLGVIAIVVMAFVSLFLGSEHLPNSGIPQGKLYPSFPTQRPEKHSILVQAKHGAAATENEMCSKIGVQTMKDGGNAVDAMISSTLCTGVVNMFSSGIGGGGFMTVRVPPKHPSNQSEVFTIDFREVAPRAANSTMFNHDPRTSMYGGLSIAVPGELRGLEEAHRRWGTLPWEQLVLPSVQLADGWIVGPELAKRIQMFESMMLGESDWRAVFAPEGKLLEEGDFISRKPLARTLETIAREGVDAFYKGPIADALLQKIASAGGIMTQDDLDSYHIRVQEANKGTYRGRTFYTTSAPSSGSVLLHMLNLLESYENFVEDGRTDLNTHRIVEVMKFGFAARTRISDPIHPQDISRMSRIASKEFGEIVSANLTDDTTHPPEYYHPIYDVQVDHGTAHVAIIDEDGMVVSLTTSVNLVFGSGVLDPVTGVILNDEMDDFAKPEMPNFFGLWPSPYNYPAPGKRPLSSMAPTIIEDSDGNFQLALGGSGGSRIFGAVLQVILGVDWGMAINEAIEFPRVHDQLFPTLVDIDSSYPEGGIHALYDRGHNVTVNDYNRITSVIQAVQLLNGTIYAASDARKNGIAAGY